MKKVIESENCVYDRFHYLTKVRAYMLSGKNQMAYNLLMKLQYYTEIADRRFMQMEVKLLQAIVLYRTGQDRWDDFLQEVLDFAYEYHFVRLISREGAGVIKLLCETLLSRLSQTGQGRHCAK